MGSGLHPLSARCMRDTMLALLPGTVWMIYALGWGVVVNLIIAAAVACSSEYAASRCRGLPAAVLLGDGSAMLTGWLLALALPPYLAWWVTAIGAAAAIIIGKQLYGGLGNNIFNPAMVGYGVAILSFPQELTLWPSPAVLEQRFSWELAVSALFGSAPADALSGATTLDRWRMHGTVQAWSWQWLGFLGGGIWLLYRRVISWHIPAAMLTVLALGGALAAAFDAAGPVTVEFHLVTGAAMLGAFFIATDPATSPRAPAGKLLFGAGTGALLLVIRHHGTYIDGLAFAVLLMNTFVPLLNRMPRLLPQ